MSIIARGYTHHSPVVAPDPVTVVKVRSREDYDALVSARHDLWWTAEITDDGFDRLGRWSGYLLAAAGLLALLGLAGWIEGL